MGYPVTVFDALPVSGASVTLTGPSTVTTETNAAARYSAQLSQLHGM